MKTALAPSNIILFLLVAVALGGAGCQTAEERKLAGQLSTFRLHLETNPDSTGRSAQVPIYRERPVMVNVVKEPFLDEGSVLRAWVENSLGGFAIKVQFDTSATWLLDGVTASNKGRHIAIFTQFPDARWLGAPVIQQRITDGVIAFTPDATREEADRIVRGINNIVKKAKKNSNLGL